MAQFNQELLRQQQLSTRGRTPQNYTPASQPAVQEQKSDFQIRREGVANQKALTLAKKELGQLVRRNNQIRQDIRPGETDSERVRRYNENEALAAQLRAKISVLNKATLIKGASPDTPVSGGYNKADALAQSEKYKAEKAAAWAASPDNPEAVASTVVNGKAGYLRNDTARNNFVNSPGMQDFRQKSQTQNNALIPTPYAGSNTVYNTLSGQGGKISTTQTQKDKTLARSQPYSSAIGHSTNTGYVEMFSETRPLTKAERAQNKKNVLVAGFSAAVPYGGRELSTTKIGDKGFTYLATSFTGDEQVTEKSSREERVNAARQNIIGAYNWAAPPISLFLQNTDVGRKGTTQLAEAYAYDENRAGTFQVFAKNVGEKVNFGLTIPKQMRVPGGVVGTDSVIKQNPYLYFPAQVFKDRGGGSTAGQFFGLGFSDAAIETVRDPTRVAKESAQQAVIATVLSGGAAKLAFKTAGKYGIAGGLNFDKALIAGGGALYGYEINKNPRKTGANIIPTLVGVGTGIGAYKAMVGKPLISVTAKGKPTSVVEFSGKGLRYKARITKKAEYDVALTMYGKTERGTFTQNTIMNVGGVARGQKIPSMITVKTSAPKIDLLKNIGGKDVYTGEYDIVKNRFDLFGGRKNNFVVGKISTTRIKSGTDRILMTSDIYGGGRNPKYLETQFSTAKGLTKDIGKGLFRSTIRETPGFRGKTASRLYPSQSIINRAYPLKTRRVIGKKGEFRFTGGLGQSDAISRPRNEWNDFTGLGKSREVVYEEAPVFNPTKKMSVQRIRSIPLQKTLAPSFSFGVPSPKALSFAGPGFLTGGLARFSSMSNQRSTTRSLPKAITEYGVGSSSLPIPRAITIPYAIPEVITEPITLPGERTIPETFAPAEDIPFFPDFTRPPTPSTVMPPIGWFGGFDLRGRRSGGGPRKNRTFAPSRTIAEVTFNLGGRYAKAAPGGYTGLEIARSYDPLKRKSRRKKSRRGKRR